MAPPATLQRAWVKHGTVTVGVSVCRECMEKYGKNEVRKHLRAVKCPLPNFENVLTRRDEYSKLFK